MELFAPGHLLVVLAIAILVFGPKKLPELGRGLGEAIRGFKGSLSGADEPAAPAPPVPAAKTDASKTDRPN
jgi:sec-independent protein translocase protein TatA